MSINSKAGNMLLSIATLPRIGLGDFIKGNRMTTVQMYKIKDAMEILGIKRKKIYELLRSGDLKGRKLSHGRNGLWLINGESLARYVNYLSSCQCPCHEDHKISG